MQRYSDSVNTDLTIQRSGGDDLSLMTEIVPRKHNSKLFEDHDNKVNEPFRSPETSSLHTDEGLSEVLENRSEFAESHYKPKIEIQIEDSAHS